MSARRRSETSPSLAELASKIRVLRIGNVRRRDIFRSRNGHCTQCRKRLKQNEEVWRLWTAASIAPRPFSIRAALENGRHDDPLAGFIVYHKFLFFCEACGSRRVCRWTCMERNCRACQRVVVEGPIGKAPLQKNCFCCDKCKNEYWVEYRREKRLRLRDPQKTCVICGENFTPARCDAKTCSPACRQKAYRQRRAASHIVLGRLGMAANGRNSLKRRISDWPAC